jgi:hypothetical protein
MAATRSWSPLCVEAGWRVIFRHKEAGHERVVLEHFNGGSAHLADIVLREGAAA